MKGLLLLSWRPAAVIRERGPLGDFGAVLTQKLGDFDTEPRHLQGLTTCPRGLQRRPVKELLGVMSPQLRRKLAYCEALTQISKELLADP
mmetsp:Transcript_6761/g.14709  ORF Transcript_6761/g.14709 Transcript_6761/m.14709 type:complete len:90 (-) Transcript_6761:291-560(-)